MLDSDTLTDQPMEDHPFNEDISATEHGDVVAHCYHAVQPPVADSDMSQMFDFEGYHNEHQPRSNYPQQGSTDFNQRYRNSQQEGSTSSGHSEDDDDGWQALYESALANYYFDDPLKCHCVPLQSLTFFDDLSDTPGFTDVADIIPLHSVEKWDVDSTTMVYLASLMALSVPGDSLSTHCGVQPPLRDVKLEDPVLQSDPATDMLRLSERNTVRLDPKDLKPFSLDNRHDQALQWSRKSLKLPDDMEKQLITEKMDVASETGQFLKEVFEVAKDEIESSLSKDGILKVHVNLQHSMRNVIDINRLQFAP